MKIKLNLNNKSVYRYQGYHNNYNTGNFRQRNHNNYSNFGSNNNGSDKKKWIIIALLLLLILVLIGTTLGLLLTNKNGGGDKPILPSPTNLKSTNITENEIDIEFDKSSGSYSEKVDEYDIQYSKQNDFSYYNNITIPSSENTYKIIGLESETEYYIRVYAASHDYSDSNFSSVLDKTTSVPIGDKVSPPSDLKETNITQNEIDVKFKKSSSESIKIKSYNVQTSTSSDFKNINDNIISKEEDSFNITGLESKTTYWIRVYALGEDGFSDSDYSNVISVETKDGGSGEGPNLPDIHPRPEVFPSDWGYGSGKNWEDKIYSPFVDMVSRTTPDLNVFNDEMGSKYFNLGFVQTMSGSTSETADGIIPWGWGGFDTLTEDNPSEQYNIIKSSIKNFRDRGGDVALSFGGAAGIPFWNNDFATVDNLAKTYITLINGMGLSRIDFDIESIGVGYEENEVNAKAVKRAQDETGVQVEITLPILQTGLIDPGFTILQEYLDAGVRVSTLNVMSMCFGTDMGEKGELDDILMSLESLKNQIKDLWLSEQGITLTDEEAYHIVGVTPSIGYESELDPPVYASDWKGVAKFGEEHNIGMLSDWVENRDALDDTYAGEQSKYEGGIKNQWEYGNIGRDNFVDENFQKVDPPTPSPINGFKLDSKTFDSAKISWNDSQPNGIDTRIYFANDGDEEYKLIDTVSNQSTYDLNYLEPNKSYWILLAAVNENSEKEFSQPIKFTTDKVPKDTEPPKWDSGQKIEINDDLSSYNCVNFSFDKATDNVGVKKYVVTISKNGETLDTAELINGVDFFDEDTNLTVDFQGLELNQTYDLSVVAYDYSDNVSNSISLSYDSGGYPLFDYDKSQDDFYKKGDIVKFTSTDSDWVSAGIGEVIYEKTKGYGKGWAPDGTTTQNRDSTEYAPGEMRPESTGWDVASIDDELFDKKGIEQTKDYSNEFISNKEYFFEKIIYKRNLLK